MASQLQEALKSLCNNTAWSYAVFWKLKQKVLEWEDGFCKSNKKLSCFPNFGTSWPSCYQLDDFIEMAVEKMSCQSYPVGDGIIGQLACTDMHRWISKPTEKELPTGWLEQFAAGIKTIAVIAVQEGSVVQLGSTEVTSEDLNLVGHVRALFSRADLQTQERMDTLVSESQRPETYDGRSHTTEKDAFTLKRMRDISDVWSSLVDRGRHVKDEQYLSLHSHCETSLVLQGSTLGLSPITSQEQTDHPLSSPRSCNQLQKQDKQSRPTSLLDDCGSNSLVQWSSARYSVANQAALGDVTAELMEPFFTEPSHEQTIDCSMLNVTTPYIHNWQLRNVDVARKRPRYSLDIKNDAQLACSDEAASGGSGTRPRPRQSVGMSCMEITSQAHVQGLFVPDVADASQHSFVSGNSTLHNIEAMSSDKSNICCAHDGLLDVHTFDLFNSHNSGELAYSHSSDAQNASSVPCVEDMEHSSKIEASSEDILQELFSRELHEFDNFLATLQTKEEVQSNEVRSCTLNSDKPSETWNRSYGASFWDHGWFRPSLRSKHSPTEELRDDASTSCQSTIVGNNALQKGGLGETFETKFLLMSRNGETPKISSHFRNPEYKTSHQEPQKPGASLSTHAEDDLSRACKKRSRQRENSRPRPKDRQLIQDRVHELRSIIPSSGKCSIDALLEKTIKYMTFLQTVTEEAGIWNDQSKVQGDVGENDSNMKEAGGASWVLELGGHGRDFPLFVENLKQPQHMLVEMLCEEEGLFLEIASTLKGLGLKVLRGLMELRDEKMWARWVIKGNEHVHRVHIMWALMHLMESSPRAASSVTDSACAG